MEEFTLHETGVDYWGNWFDDNVIVNAPDLATAIIWETYALRYCTNVMVEEAQKEEVK